jgi:uncharacterized protein (DUF4415 family)
MKNGNDKKPHMVRIESDGAITPEIEAELKAIAEMSDDDIDYSDIPQITDFSGFEVGKFYRPLKETVTMRLDADVLHWLRKDGRGYQSRLNAILRKEMTSQSNKRKAA